MPARKPAPRRLASTPAASTTIKAPSLLGEFRDFVKGLAPDLPYQLLVKSAIDAGWVWHLRQAGVDVAPDASVLVHTDVYIGKSYEHLELFDTVTVRVAPQAAPVTASARMQIDMSIVFLAFGRLPPAPAAPAAPPRPAESEAPPAAAAPPEATRRTVEMPDEDIVLPEADDEPVPRLDIIAKREPDGLPIFTDLYKMGADTRHVISSLLDEVDEYLSQAAALEQVAACFAKNEEAMEFVKDLGTDEEKRELRVLFATHKDRLQAAPMPRRRTAARH